MTCKSVGAKKWIRCIFLCFVLGVILYMPLFGHMGSLPIRIWDESRLAMNALEMYHNGNYLVTYFDGTPDMWNTKPPLLIVLQVFFMKLFGIHEISLRLPSALAALGTCILILVFSIRYLKSFWFGFIAILVLITSSGYIGIHAVRTADYDALLTFFTTACSLSLFAYLETNKTRYLYFFFTFISLGVLTKSSAIFMLFPSFFLYLLLRKQLVTILKNKHFYLGLVVCMLPILSYYLGREYYNPGYLQAVWDNELGGRYFQVIEGHRHNAWFFLENLTNKRFSAYYLLVPCGIAIGLFHKDIKIRRITIFSLMVTLCFLLIISLAKTKLEWYDVPLYPFASILVAVSIFYIFRLLSESLWVKKTLRYNIVPSLLLFLLFVSPYKKIFNSTCTPEEESWDKDFYRVGYYLKDALKGKTDCHNTIFVFDGYAPQNTFYIKLLQKKGITTSAKEKDSLQVGDIVIVSEQSVHDFIKTHYEAEEMDTWYNIQKYRITNLKENE